MPIHGPALAPKEPPTDLLPRRGFFRPAGKAQRAPRELDPGASHNVAIQTVAGGIMAGQRRTTHRSTAGKKLYAVRDARGRFIDIQTFERAHRADLKRKSKKEKK